MFPKEKWMITCLTAVRFGLGKKENSAIAALLMDFILKHKAKGTFLLGRFAGKMVLYTHLFYLTFFLAIFKRKQNQEIEACPSSVVT